MSEQLLRAFRDDAVHRTRVPAFEQIEAAGRSRRHRRHAVVAAVTACVLGVSSLLAWGPDRSGAPQPAQHVKPSADVMPYPSDMMTTLDEGTYELAPSQDPKRPVVRFTLPGGWNAWYGPNRFEGMAPGVTNNEELLGRTSWFTGLLVMELRKVARRSDCAIVDMTGSGRAALVRSLTRLPHVDVLSGPESTVRFGVPATYLRLRERPATRCLADHRFTTSRWASVGFLEPGTTYDAWVLDVGDRPFLVWTYRSPDAPAAEVASLMGVVDSIEVHPPE